MMFIHLYTLVCLLSVSNNFRNIFPPVAFIYLYIICSIFAMYGVYVVLTSHFLPFMLDWCVTVLKEYENMLRTRFKNALPYSQDSTKRLVLAHIGALALGVWLWLLFLLLRVLSVRTKFYFIYINWFMWIISIWSVITFLSFIALTYTPILGFFCIGSNIVYFPSFFLFFGYGIFFFFVNFGVYNFLFRFVTIFTELLLRSLKYLQKINTDTDGVYFYAINALFDTLSSLYEEWSALLETDTWVRYPYITVSFILLLISIFFTAMLIFPFLLI